jgi:hypothetical protein
MPEQADNLVLEHLKALCNELPAAKSDIQAGLRDIKARLTSIERHQAGSYLDSARQGSRIDELDRRIERIEHRLELADGV